MAYTKTDWVNDSSPYINEANLDKLEQGVYDAHVALGTKAPVNNPTFTGTVSGITKAMVGLGSVDNTADVDKPVSTAQAAADTAAKDRANHTGTQLAATISDLAEVIRDTVGLALDGTGVVSVTVDDVNETITISSTATQNSPDATLLDRANHTGTQDASTISGLAAVATSGAYSSLTGAPAIPDTADDVGAVPASKTVTVDPAADGQFGSWTIQYSTSGSSSTVLDVFFQPDGPAGTIYHTFWLNENGAPRAGMGKASDSALKIIGWGSGQSGNTFEVQRYSGSGTGSRTNDFAIGPDGMPRIGPSDVPAALCVVIASTDTAPPAGTPVGTVVVRKQA